jgi:hypothetical protein
MNEGFAGCGAIMSNRKRCKCRRLAVAVVLILGIWLIQLGKEDSP